MKLKLNWNMPNLKCTIFYWNEIVVIYDLSYYVQSKDLQNITEKVLNSE